MRWMVVPLLAAACALGSAATAGAGSRLALRYDVYYLRLPVLAIDVTSQVEGDGYRATVDLRTAGIFDVLARWRSRATASGRVAEGLLVPASYRVETAYGDRRQEIDLAYDADGTVRGGVHGILTDGERDAVPDALRVGTVDPVTAGVVPAQRLVATGSCAGTVAIFDGLRRYDLRYDDLGLVELPPSRGDEHRGLARHCRATVQSIAGFLRGGERSGERATEISAWLASPVTGAPPVAVRLALRGTRGTLHVHLARATPLPAVGPARW